MRCCTLEQAQRRTSPVGYERPFSWLCSTGWSAELPSTRILPKWGRAEGQPQPGCTYRTQCDPVVVAHTQVASTHSTEMSSPSSHPCKVSRTTAAPLHVLPKLSPENYNEIFPFPSNKWYCNLNKVAFRYGAADSSLNTWLFTQSSALGASVPLLYSVLFRVMKVGQTP